MYLSICVFVVISIVNLKVTAKLLKCEVYKLVFATFCKPYGLNQNESVFSSFKASTVTVIEQRNLWNAHSSALLKLEPIEIERYIKIPCYETQRLLSY